MKTRVGYFDSIMWNSPADALKHAVMAENIGFDMLWVEDHFHPTCQKCESGFAWSWMGSALQATKKIPIGTAVTCPTMRYTPQIVAQAFATMASMYPGRVVLGLGAGEAISEAACTGKWPSNAERQEMLVEAVDVIKKLWYGKENFSFKGKYYTLDQAFMYTRPSAEFLPLIYYSGMGPKSSRLAGIYGDHLITVFGAPEMIKNVTIPEFEKGAKEAGKDPKKMERVCFMSYSADPDYDKAVEGTRDFVGCTFPFFTKYKVVDPRELDACAAMMTHDALAAQGSSIMATNAEDMIKVMEKYKAAGITHFCMGNMSPNKEFGIKIFKDIIPYFKNE